MVNHSEDITFQDVPNEPDTFKEPNIVFLKFADAAVPVFKEERNKDYIKYGDKNEYPEYLTYLFNKSGKHNAIITGKAKYIFGKGYENGDAIINRLNESLNDITKKALLDIEIYGGFKFEVIWNFRGLISEVYHVDFCCIRKGKDGGFFYKEIWKEGNREEERFIPCFDPSNPKGNQIFEYNEYRPGSRFYPLPGYLGSNNYIETDIEISKYYLSAIRNGMMPSKMIQFFKGDPPDEKKRAIENRFSKKFAGAENAGKFIMVFNDANATKSVEINDLSASELDKQFIELNKTTQQEIFAGHNITSPMLFGIMEPGKLGGGTELQLAYSIFQNTYAEPKAQAFDKEVNWLLSFSNFKGEYHLQPTDPVGLQFDVKDVIQSLPKAFVFHELGIPEDMWDGETIGGTTGAPMPTGNPQQTNALGNENIKNLSAKQHQQLMRIINQYNKGLLTPGIRGTLNETQAKTLLRTGLGLSDDDINNLLGIQAPLKLSFTDQQEIVLGMFDACGDSKNDFSILKSKKVGFSEIEAEGDEEIFIKEAFKTVADLTATEAKIIELIKKDAKITPEVLATATGETVAFIKSKIESLTKRGYLESSTEMVGIDEIVTRSIPADVDIKLPPPGKINPTQIYIKYSYEGPQDSRNRPFCARLMELSRLYSRAEIETISARLGYSVFDRRGGFYNHNGVIEPHCRHNWKSNIVTRKGQ
jgi:hypothetical protein